MKRMTHILRLVALLLLFWTQCQGLSIRSQPQDLKSRCYVERNQRERCQIEDDSELKCLQSGCCYDDTVLYQYNGGSSVRCFQPLVAGGSENHVCYVHSRDRQMCGNSPLPKNECLSRGCCYAWTGNLASSLCFRANNSSPDSHEQVKTCDVPELSRKLCAYGGIVRKVECEERGCCFAVSNLPNVPWCFSSSTNEQVDQESNELTDLKESLVDAFESGLDSLLLGDGTNDISAQNLASEGEDLPSWLKNIMNVISTITPTQPTTTATAETQNGRATTAPPTAGTDERQIIADETSCRKTYELLMSLRGDEECSTQWYDRISCVEGDLPRLQTESECTACTKLGCCYDPSFMGSGYPHCYKDRSSSVVVTSPPTTTLPTTAFTTKPRWVQLLNSMGITVNEDGSTSASQGQSSPGFGQGKSPWGSTKTNQLPYGLPNSNPMMPSGFPGNSPYRPASNPGMLPGGVPGFTPNVDSSLGIGFDGKGKGAGNMNPLLAAGGLSQNRFPGFPLPNFGQGTGSPSSQNTQSLLSGLIGNQPQSNNQAMLFSLLSGNQGAQAMLPGFAGNQAPKTPGNSASQSLLSGLLGGQQGTSSNQGMQSLLSSLLGNNLPNNVAQPANPFLSLFTSPPPTTTKTPTTTTATATTAKTTEPTPTDDSDNEFIPLTFEKTKKALPGRLCYPENAGTLGSSHSYRAAHRIVGGQWSGGIDYWPWMASFRRNFTDDWRYKHVCGATLISKRWILTAGHCFMMYRAKNEKVFGKPEPNPRAFAVHLGTYYRDEAELTTQVYAVQKFIAHPEYDFRSLKHDIAVAKLKEDVTINDYVRPARLPVKTSLLEVGARTWVTGWGETLRVGDHNESKLKELALPLISTRNCKKFWEKHFHPSWICTAAALNEDACTGDSGGPLVHQDYDKRWDVIGVAIAGTKRCSTDKNDIRPGIYTNVAYYREFIDAATGGTC